jgi:hypothetical protein
MATTNPRINITVPPEVAAALADKAERNRISLSKAALEFIKDAIERDEDVYFSRLAARREQEHTDWISHEKAWGHL